MKSSPSETTAISVPDLRAEFDGRVIAPDDVGYDEARTVVAGGIDRRPAVIIRPADAAEVARVVSLARESGLELAVRSGGHSGAGHGVSEGGIVLDLANMRNLDVDVDGRTALGGGVGFLSRKYGLTIDNLLAAEVVTADGEIVRVDADTHPDLFWAIRGGGGNFGVVTRFQFRLHQVDTVVGGMLMLPTTPEVIAGFVAEAEAAPEELTTIVNVMPAPPMPFVPADYHGRLVVMALMAYAGDSGPGERVMAPFRALATPVVDMVRSMPYPEIFAPEEEGYHPVAAVRTLFVDTIDEQAAATIVDHLQASDAMMRVAQLRVLGGAVARVPVDATAFAHRRSPMMVNVAAIYEDPDQAATHHRWVTDFAAALHQGDTGAYVGFIGDEGEARVRDAYPEPTWQRLAAIKGRYDPTNLFRLNQNVPPAR